MNFQSFKIMCKSLVHTFKCPDCGSNINEQSIDIMGVAGNNINFDIECPKCNEHSIFMAQLMATQIPIEIKMDKGNSIENLKNKLSKIEKYKDKLSEISEILENNKNDTNFIKDKEIIYLNKKLKSESFSMNDLFGDINNNK